MFCRVDRGNSTKEPAWMASATNTLSSMITKKSFFVPLTPSQLHENQEKLQRECEAKKKKKKNHRVKRPNKMRGKKC